MLEAYIDESGTQSKDTRSLLFLAAYVAESDNWAKVSTEWTQLLKEYKVPHFHMNELRNVTKGLYRHLSMPARMRLLDGLIGTLKKYALFGCLITLRPHEYAIVADQQFRNRYGSAYGMCVNLLLRQLHNSLLNPLSGPETINVFLERGHANEGDAIRQLKDWKELTDPPPNEVEGQPVERKVPCFERTDLLRIGTYGSGTKDQMPPLHAADLLAYIANSNAEIALNGRDDRFIEEIGDRLFASIPHISTSWNESALRSLVEAVREGDEEKSKVRSELHQMTKALNSFGLKVTKYPWGFTVDGRHLSEEEWRAYLAARPGIKDAFSQFL